ncbi:hypothetical protein NQ315_000385 [Exocentrus adspersus]|uniref:Large ribosomal subunit protein uL22 n=1 Tax=Exocentrus adspersus TaxID=1586481 RepID=A0AAV8VLM5_9CUCU|nr:hypothetical protein NQ315_000385 [Exocentrus adspersus]
MVKYGSSHRYSQKITEGSEVIRAKMSNVTVKFKNLVEIARVLRKMTMKRANAYLKNVLARKECVPFKRFKSGIGKCAQAKQFNTQVGRWPVKAVRCVQDLLKNAAANCEFYGKDPDDYYIHHIQASQAPILTRRTYRAHGRINPYNRHTSHMQIILKERELNK